MAHPGLKPPDVPVSVVVVGAGAIGSHLVGLLARSPAVGSMTIVDRDTYTRDNEASQDIQPGDAGRPKAQVQARRIRRIRPSLRVRAIVGDVRSIPLGQLRGKVIFACVDTRVARQSIHQCAFRLGIPWVDAGVKSDDLLARVHVYSSLPADACLECAWSQREYDLLEQRYPCQAEPAPAPTNAPAALGALAASLQALEFEKWVAAKWGPVRAGHQVLVDAAGHRDRVTRFVRNPDCRFDHRNWTIETVDCPPRDITLGQAIELGRIPGARSGSLGLAVDRKRWVTETLCPGCGSRKASLYVESAAHPRPCLECGTGVRVTPVGFADEIETGRIPRHLLERSLRDLELDRGDVLSLISSSGERHFEVCPPEVAA